VQYMPANSTVCACFALLLQLVSFGCISLALSLHPALAAPTAPFHLTTTCCPPLQEWYPDQPEDDGAEEGDNGDSSPSSRLHFHSGQIFHSARMLTHT